MVKAKETVIDTKLADQAQAADNGEESEKQLRLSSLQVDTADKERSTGAKGFELVDPFGKDIRNADLFKHRQLEELQSLVRTCIAKRGLGLVTGPAGSGKTTAVRSVTDELPSNKYSIIYLGQDQDGTNILTRFAISLGLQPTRFRPRLAMQISRWLIDNLDSGGKETVLVLDESHLVENSMLEEFRLMTNANYDRQSPLTLVLIGHPLLRQRLKSPDFEALRQRLRYRYSLEGLDQDETIEYIRQRLSAAGLSPDLISAEALRFIFQATEGLPRRINNVCSLALLKAGMLKLSTIDLTFIKEVGDLD